MYYIDEYPKILVTWTYPDKIDCGVINGYILRVYKDSSYSNLKSSYDISTTSLNASKVLDIKTDLERGILNYISITPYYNKPDGSGKMEGTSLKSKFIIPIGRLHKPIIDGPISGTTWHNNQFRILVTAPEDDDFDIENISTSNYRYNNIELNINGISYYYNTNNSIYSTNTVSYKKALVINPSIINNFEDTNTYQIKIRFQKKYFQNIWSEWSNTITLYKSKITELNLLVDQIIEISHYKTVRNYSTRLYDVYFINRNSLPKDNIDKNQYDIIITENYQGIYDTILAIKNKVNNYATFDSERENIKFNQNINDLDGNNKVTKGEIITANKISNNPIGRNYMNILINDMNKLY